MEDQEQDKGNRTGPDARNRVVMDMTNFEHTIFEHTVGILFFLSPNIICEFLEIKFFVA